MNMKETVHHMENKNNFEMSLYDYLGRPAGKELGGEVAKAAKTQNIPYKIREVSNPKYKGKICLYPKWFLDQYFNKPKEEYQLPF